MSKKETAVPETKKESTSKESSLFPPHSPQFQALKKKIIDGLTRNGELGYSRLNSFLRIADKDKNGVLSKTEIVKGLAKYGITLYPREVEILDEFDRDGDGRITYVEFLSALKGPMNERRKAIVRRAFDKLDKDGSGEVTIDDIRHVYSAKNSTDVLRGKKTEKEVLEEFLGRFEAGPVKDGVVTWEEFLNYYNGKSFSFFLSFTSGICSFCSFCFLIDISVCVEDDRHFTLMIFQYWNL